MENKVQEITPIEKLRELVKTNPDFIHADSEDVFNGNMDLSFTEYVNSDDEDKDKAVKKHNKKRFNLFRKGKEKKEADETATSVYQSRYDRETWYYKRHKDTIDKYVKKEEKDSKKKDSDILVVQNQDDEVLRIGFLKMWFIVMFDWIFCTIIANIIGSPVHLLKCISEIFYRMKKSVAITVIILVGIILVVVGLILGINYIFSFAQGLS